MALKSFEASNSIANADPRKQVKDFLDARQVFTKHFPVDKEGFQCQFCKKSVKKQCNGCKIGIFYCSNTCLQADWKDHKGYCGRRYESLEVPQKGKGNLATRNISKGEIICVERPVLLINTFKNGNDINAREVKKVFKKTFKNLTNTQQEAIMNLSHPFIDDKKSETDKVFSKFLEIIKTNGISLKESDEFPTGRIPYDAARKYFLIAKVGLFLDFSRFNHSCMPNSDYFYANPYIRLYATRDIMKGEEITFSYCGDSLGRTGISYDSPKTIQEMKVYLKSLINSLSFVCYCEFCQIEDKKKLEEMYDFRHKFSKLQKKIKEKNGLPSKQGYHEYIRNCRKMLDHINSSNELHLFWTIFYSKKGMTAAFAARDRIESIYFLKQYYESVVIRNGKGSAIPIMVKLVLDHNKVDENGDTDLNSFFDALEIVVDTFIKYHES